MGNYLYGWVKLRLKHTNCWSHSLDHERASVRWKIKTTTTTMMMTTTQKKRRRQRDNQITIQTHARTQTESISENLVKPVSFYLRRWWHFAGSFSVWFMTKKRQQRAHIEIVVSFSSLLFRDLFGSQSFDPSKLGFVVSFFVCLSFSLWQTPALRNTVDIFLGNFYFVTKNIYIYAYN